MIQCPVCLAKNDDFAITCAHCKAFLQNKIPNLDFFETAWKVLESPRKTFHNIVLAEHKNYAIVLFALFGISISFTAFWYFKLGNRFETLLDLIPFATVIGFGVGVVLAVLLSTFYHLFAKLLGGATTFRNSYAILAYSLTPIVASLFLVLPIELLTFGMFLFTSNPHPYTIKPISYVALVGFDGAVGVWSIFLAIVGTVVGHRINIAKASIAVLFTLGILGGAFFSLANILQAAR